MLAALREKLLEHLRAVAGLTDLYAGHDPAFRPRCTQWMSQVEETLLRFRSPLASQVAAERLRVEAARDGYRDPDVRERSRSARRSERASAAVSLQRVEEAVRGRVAEIDAGFADARVRMAQLLAVSSAVRPLPCPPPELHAAWLQKTWSGLALTDETRTMYSYLNAALAPSDRLYLLADVLRNLLPPHTPTA